MNYGALDYTDINSALLLLGIGDRDKIIGLGASDGG